MEEGIEKPYKRYQSAEKKPSKSREEIKELFDKWKTDEVLEVFNKHKLYWETFIKEKKPITKETIPDLLNKLNKQIVKFSTHPFITNLPLGSIASPFLFNYPQNRCTILVVREHPSFSEVENQEVFSDSTGVFMKKTFTQIWKKASEGQNGPNESEMVHYTYMMPFYYESGTLLYELQTFYEFYFSIYLELLKPSFILAIGNNLTYSICNKLGASKKKVIITDCFNLRNLENAITIDLKSTKKTIKCFFAKHPFQIYSTNINNIDYDDPKTLYGLEEIKDHSHWEAFISDIASVLKATFFITKIEKLQDKNNMKIVLEKMNIEKQEKAKRAEKRMLEKQKKEEIQKKKPKLNNDQTSIFKFFKI
jgi:hypothetical protein